MKVILFVGLGSFVGGVLRYGISSIPLGAWVKGFPLWTLIINILGCFLLGYLSQYAEQYHLSRELKLALTVGLCGGFTTFSTFSLESLRLLEQSAYVPFFLYTFLSLTLGVAAVFIGRALAMAQ